MTDFYKFHGTGNDFIMLDGRNFNSVLSAKTIAAMCHRQFGIGADGLIIVAPEQGFDFVMIYFNADGSPADMCGNGARCASAFASMIGITGDKPFFMAGDGPHTGIISRISGSEWIVEISMKDVPLPETYGVKNEINTGAPHYVIMVPDVSETDTLTEGRKIRYSPEYKLNGINVDWCSIDNDVLHVRTYERGVENETLSCGTGVTACAMIAGLKTGISAWEVETQGGRLEVSFQKNSSHFTGVKLKGPVKLVYKGETDLSTW